MKLEVGCGTKPFSLDPIWEHMDAVAFPHVEIVGDISVIPRPDETYDEVYSHWVLEHFHRTTLPAVLKEWKRVLKPGGKIRGVTTYAEAINAGYAKGELTWEEWDYLIFAHPKKEDLHKIGFTPDYLCKFFTDIGMTPVITGVRTECKKDGKLMCPAIIIEATK